MYLRTSAVCFLVNTPPVLLSAENVGTKSVLVFTASPFLLRKGSVLRRAYDAQQHIYVPIRAPKIRISSSLRNPHTPLFPLKPDALTFKHTTKPPSDGSLVSTAHSTHKPDALTFKRFCSRLLFTL